MKLSKILFISHEATLTGAPQSLLNIMEWIRSHTQEISFQILLKKRGPLQSRYAALAEVLDFTPPRTTLGQRILYKLGLKPPTNVYDIPKLRRIRQRLIETRFDLIYSNTITNGELLEFLAPLKCPVITHVRELEHVIQVFGAQNLAQVRQRTDHYIATAQVVKDNLVQNHRIPASIIDVIPTFINPDITAVSSPHHPIRDLGIPEEAFIVGGCGTRDWRKGTDLFLHLARIMGLTYLSKPVHWVWIGGSPGNSFAQQLVFDWERMQLQGRVHFIDDVSNPLDYLKDLDVFVLTSREDPLARVMLEAALWLKPLVVFADAGGGSEFVGTEGGFCVPYLHLEAMVEKIQVLLASPDLRQQMGSSAYQKVKDCHNVEVSAPRILQVIESVIRNSHPRALES